MADYHPIPTPFVWDESFLVGDADADVQHRKLFALVAAFEANPNKTTYNDVLHELRFHFDEEENDLPVDDEDTTGHLAEHSRTLQKFARRKPSPKTVDAVKKWLVNHIKETDMKLKGHFGNANNGFDDELPVVLNIDDDEEEDLPWYKDKNEIKLIIMICLSSCFMCSEMGIGFYTGSLALVSDAFHMIADAISYVIAFIAILWSKRTKGQNYTYGWERSEIVGAFINGVLLLTICLFITMEAIQRFITLPEVQNPLLVTYVGCGGVVLNLAGMFMFGEMDECCETPEEDVQEGEPDLKKSPSPDQVKKDNLRAVFIHIVGDLVGQICAIASGLLINFLPYHWKYYFDPSLSMVIVFILFYHSVPIVKRSMQIFMQRVPKFIKMDELQKQLLAVPEVVNVHELHVWSLAGETTISSCHLTLLKGANFIKILTRFKDIFHTFGIHSITIQPEYVSVGTLEAKHPKCQLSCAKNQCRLRPCCPPSIEAGFNPDAITRLKLGLSLHVEDDSIESTSSKQQDISNKKKAVKQSSDDEHVVITEDSEILTQSDVQSSGDANTTLEV